MCKCNKRITMDFNVSNVTFGKSTRNWSARGVKAPNKAAYYADKVNKTAEDYVAKRLPTEEKLEAEIIKAMQGAKNILKGKSLKDIISILPKY